MLSIQHACGVADCVFYGILQYETGFCVVHMHYKVPAHCVGGQGKGGEGEVRQLCRREESQGCTGSTTEEAGVAAQETRRESRETGRSC
jgi:hypothetical protein